MTDHTGRSADPDRRNPSTGHGALGRVLKGAAWTVLIVLAGKIAVEIWMGQVSPMSDLPAWITQRPIAHRGLHDAAAGIPPNSMSAFLRAVEANCPIELDVHLLADGGLAVIHDFTLAPRTGDPRSVEDCTAAEIRSLTLDHTSEHIPLLQEVLAAVRGRVPILIELKNASRTDRDLERAVGAVLAGYAGPVAVASFNPFSLKWFRKHFPQIPRGQLACDFAREDTTVDKGLLREFLVQHLLLTHYSQPAFIAYDVRCLPAWAPGLKRDAGLPVIGWTVRSEAERTDALRYCDNVIFESFQPRHEGPAASSPVR